MKTFLESIHGGRPRGPGRRGRTAARLGGGLVAASVALLAGASYSQASTYLVYTSSISAMTLNANDGYCSLAEAVASANAGHSMYNCQEIFPGGDQQIQILEASGKSFSAYHFRITSLTIDSPNRWIDIFSPSGSRFFIDSTGASGFVVKAGTSLGLTSGNFTFTGTSGGRHVENYGNVNLSDATFANGNVTSHPNGYGGAIVNRGTMTTFSVVFTNNRAKRGGAIYNDNGTIEDLNTTTVSGNSATMAGGGIYNNSTILDANGDPKGAIRGRDIIVTSNSARAGGGVFNGGLMDVRSTSITFNTATNSGSSGEACKAGVTNSCDGHGGGVLTLSRMNMPAILRLHYSSVLSDNKALSGFGGGTYNTGQMLVSSATVARNQAKDGAAFYVSTIASGQSQYCEMTTNTGPSSIVDNKAVPQLTSTFSIVTTGAVPDASCIFRSVPASGNSDPKCGPNSVHPGDPCPQP